MLTRDAPRSLPVTRQINYGKNLTSHDWLLIGEVELVINCLVANCFLCRTDDVSKPPARGKSSSSTACCFHSCCILTSLGGWEGRSVGTTTSGPRSARAACRSNSALASNLT